MSGNSILFDSAGQYWVSHDAGKAKSMSLPEGAEYVDMSGNSILFGYSDPEGVACWAVADGAGKPKTIREVPGDATYTGMSGNSILFNYGGQYWVSHDAGKPKSMSLPEGAVYVDMSGNSILFSYVYQDGVTYWAYRQFS
jgi:hypothetical protein